MTGLTPAREAAIVDLMVNSDLTYREIAARFGYRPSSLQSFAQRRGIKRHRSPGDAKGRISRPCIDCETRTTATARRCRRCVDIAKAGQHVPEPTYEDGLYGGRWEPRRGIRVWVSGDAA